MIENSHKIREKQIQMRDIVNLCYELHHTVDESHWAVVVDQVHVDAMFPHQGEGLLKLQPANTK